MIRMKSLDTLIFTSHQISHFNLHYVGERASLVLHSDREGDAWVRDRNGWGSNVYMSTVFLGEEEEVDSSSSDQQVNLVDLEQMDCSSD